MSHSSNASLQINSGILYTDCSKVPLSKAHAFNLEIALQILYLIIIKRGVTVSIVST